MHHSAAKRLVVLLLILALSGCSVGYYFQSARGQASLLAKRRPIPEVLADPATPPELRERLLLVQRAREFATEALQLPGKKGYRSYASLDRPYAVWNVVATPEFSLQPVEWCFPVAGCVSYRGYFREDLAEKFAQRMRERGNDVAVRGVAAYSTLGYFDDPVLNTMMRWDDIRLVAIIFHELAHQLFYIKGDTSFNESFASVVEEEGMRRWLGSTTAEYSSYTLQLESQQCFRSLVSAAHSKLESLYARGDESGRLRESKAAVFGELLVAFRQAEKRGTIGKAYEAWFEQPLNNAHLVSVGVYQQWVPALRAMLAGLNGDLAAFYAAAKELGELSLQERAAALGKIAGPELAPACAAMRH